MHAVNRPLSSHLPSQSATVSPRFPAAPPRMRRRSQSRTMPHRAMALESAVKLTLNLGVSAVAIAALVHLIPREFSQQAKLQELQVSSKVSSDRLRMVQDKFQQNFDPARSRAIMAEQTNRVDPREKTIVLQRPSSSSLTYQLNDLNDLAKQKVERPALGY
jgi:hypothetical protein